MFHYKETYLHSTISTSSDFECSAQKSIPNNSTVEKNQKDLNSSEPLIINMSSRYTNFVCLNCLQTFQFTQSILFKAIGRSLYSCPNCDCEGNFKMGVEEPSNLISVVKFLPEFLYKSSEDLEIDVLIKTAELFQELDVLMILGKFNSHSPLIESLIKFSKNTIKISFLSENSVSGKVTHLNNPETCNTRGNSSSPTEEKNSDGFNKRSVKGKKKEKVVMNHLLNFSLPPRVVNQMPALKRSSRKGSNSLYDREVFVNSNFRFMLKNKNADPSMLTNPDYKPDWADIEQVIVPSNDTLSCPICLEKPIAPRITRCGHVYCLTCILRFMSDTETARRKCPICWVPIEEDQIKRSYPVSTHYLTPKNHSKTSVGMRLMFRRMGTCLSYPIDSDIWSLPHTNTDIDFILPSSSSYPEILLFSRFMWCSKPTLIESLCNEIRDLDTSKSNTQLDDMTLMYTEYALEKIKDELKNLKNLTLDAQIPHKNSIELQNFKRGPKNNSEGSAGVGSNKPSSKISSKISSSISDGYSFYQSDDGQHIYLSQLDLRMLKDDYNNDISKMPTHINLDVNFMTRTDVTNEYRKRTKIFDHLPLRCDMIISEADLAGVVNPDIMKIYAKKLKARRDHHQSQLKRDNVQDELAIKNLRTQEIKDLTSNQIHPYHPYLHELGSANHEANSYSDFFSSGSNQHALLGIIGVSELESEFPQLSVSSQEVHSNAFSIDGDHSDNSQKNKKSLSINNDFPSIDHNTSDINSKNDVPRFLHSAPTPTAWGNASSKKSLFSDASSNVTQNRTMIVETKFINESARLKSLDDMWSKLEAKSSHKSVSHSSNKKKKKQSSGIKLSVNGSANYRLK
ncbi:putative RING finger protein [Smittium mucronatum]|uniref:Putative RING finger protein n=1 Tax=Smittium mucronatum TaxID=133383 RepID=A0A1R0GNB4_9FUNG|nr:putative RING finger protein [Smittium mucronatum]